MKQYIGTKIISAKPMTRADAEAHLGRNVGGDKHGDGYLVQYSDNYQSWSPKDVFDAAYIEIGDVGNLPPHQQRVIGEAAELRDKLNKLNAFLKGEIFESLPQSEKCRLSQQAEIMGSYLVVLVDRIAAF